MKAESPFFFYIFREEMLSLKAYRCEICGEEFMAERKKKYCDDCRDFLAHMPKPRSITYAQRLDMAKEAVKQEKKKDLTPLQQMAKEANDAGMTYGQYVLAKSQGKV